MCDTGWIVEIGVEELKVLSQAVPGGHPASQTVIVIHHAPSSGASIVSPQQLAFGVIVENVGATLAEEAILIHAILDVSQASDAISEVVSEGQDAGAVAGVEQMEVTIQVVAVAPGRPVVHLQSNTVISFNK